MHAFKINYCKLFDSIRGFGPRARYEHSSHCEFQPQSTNEIPNTLRIYRQTHCESIFMLANKFPDENERVCVSLLVAAQALVCAREHNVKGRISNNKHVNNAKQQKRRTGGGDGGVWANKCYHLLCSRFHCMPSPYPFDVASAF